MIRAGDFVEGACVTQQLGTDLLVPPFLALRLDCGPMPVDDCAGRVHQIASVNGWPKRAIAEVHILTADGRYRLAFEDGPETSGSSSAP